MFQVRFHSLSTSLLTFAVLLLPVSSLAQSTLRIEQFLWETVASLDTGVVYGIVGITASYNTIVGTPVTP